MSSQGSSDRLDSLERDLPTTPDDVKALRRLCYFPVADVETYIQRLDEWTRDRPSSRHVVDSAEPFEI